MTNTDSCGVTRDNVHERSLQYWSGRAPEYSELHERELASERGETLARFLRVQPAVAAGGDVLDLACGSGIMGIVCADAGAFVVGVDFSAQMLEQARANAERHGVSARTRYLQADARHLPFEDGSFDLVVSRNATWVMEDVDLVYAQVARVLRPGGTFINIDANYGQGMLRAEAAGETPVHPTQTLEQLLTRNAVARQLDVTFAERPMWDVKTLWDLGFSSVEAVRDFEALPGEPYARASASVSSVPFMVRAVR